MKSKNFLMNQAGISLTEIIVSLVLFSLTMASVISLLAVTRSQTASGRDRLEGAELCKYFADELQKQVRADTWGENSNLLSDGDYRSLNVPAALGYGGYTAVNGLDEPNANKLDYYPVFEVSENAVGVSTLRKAKVKICWEE